MEIFQYTVLITDILATKLPIPIPIPVADTGGLQWF